jgi:hypothetical protein
MSEDFASRPAALWACLPGGLEPFQAQQPAGKRVDLGGAKLEEQGPDVWVRLGLPARLACECGTVLADMNTSRDMCRTDGAFSARLRQGEVCDCRTRAMQRGHDATSSKNRTSASAMNYHRPHDSLAGV